MVFASVVFANVNSSVVISALWDEDVVAIDNKDRASVGFASNTPWVACISSLPSGLAGPVHEGEGDEGACCLGFVRLDHDCSSCVASNWDVDLLSVHRHEDTGVIERDGAPWVGGVGVHGLGSSGINCTVADLVALIIVPEKFNLLRALVLKGHMDWRVPCEGLVEGGLINVDDSAAILCVWGEDCVAIELDLLPSVGNSACFPWVSGVRAHVLALASGDLSVALLGS